MLLIPSTNRIPPAYRSGEAAPVLSAAEGSCRYRPSLPVLASPALAQGRSCKGETNALALVAPDASPWPIRPLFSRVARKFMKGKCLPLLPLLPHRAHVLMSSQLPPVETRIVPHCFLFASIARVGFQPTSPTSTPRGAGAWSIGRASKLPSLNRRRLFGEG
jgi:hypothetical protein